MTRTHTATDLSDREADVRSVLHGVYAAWAANDADAFVTQYTDDATVVMPGSYRSNKAEIRTHMAAGFDGPLRGSSVTDKVQSVRFPTDDTAVLVTESAILMAGEREVPAARRVRATWMLSKQQGRWLVVAYHNSPANSAS